MHRIEFFGDGARSNADMRYLETELRHGAEARRDLAPAVELFVANDCWIAAFSGPDDVVAELRATVVAAPESRDPAVPPPVLAACRAILRRYCPIVQTDGGPNYLFPDVLAATVTADIRRSDRDDPAPLRAMRPPNWEPDEWTSLLRGEVGPWAVVVADGCVVSICHTPVWDDGLWSAGSWTHPAYRGRGLGAAAVGAWSEIVRAAGRRADYNTTTANRSSQRLASRLGLRFWCWIWSVRCAPTVVDAVRASAPDPDLVLEVLDAITSWNGAVAEVSTAGAEVPHLAVTRVRPGPGFARILPATMQAHVSRQLPGYRFSDGFPGDDRLVRYRMPIAHDTKREIVAVARAAYDAFPT